ncbi:hypothetical protein [Nocardioides sp.]|uniref:hypothetical protein n=1 Tax=Nocardioides sp. TaxID=35761 RepID=UPI0035AF2143
MARQSPRRRPRRVFADHPLDGTCVLCDQPLGGGNQRTNPLIQMRAGWAHKACVLRERGE